jgi:hypothetical protein
MSVTALGVAVDRVSAGVESKAAQGIYERWKAGMDIKDIVEATVIDFAIEKYREKIVTALRRAGFEVAENAALNQETLAAMLGGRMGVELPDLSPESITLAVTERLKNEASRVLGLDVADIESWDGEVLKEAIKKSALAAVQSGRATKFLSFAKIRALKKLATWKRGNIAQDDQRKYMARWYQKKFRRSHKLVWD